MGGTSKAKEKLLDEDSRPHFFKILLFPTNLQQLPIPRKFARKFRRELSDSALLKGPNGMVWRVGLKEAGDGVVYFSDGWNVVTEHYSITIGNFLVFRYDGNSHFNVKVFDETSCEKEYPHASGNDGEQTCFKNRSWTPETQEEIDSSVEILGVSDVKDGDLLPKSRVLRSSSRLRHYNKSNVMEKKKSRGRRTSGRLGRSVNRCSKSEKAVGNKNFEQAAKPQNQTLKQSKRSKCVQSNGKKLCVSNCSSKKTVSVSNPMVSENRTEICSPSVKLESPETELHRYSSTSKPLEDEERIENEGVMRANGRVRQRMASERRSATTSDKEMALQKARKFNSNYPFFVAVMRPSYLRYMSVPVGFIKDHLPSQPQRVTIQLSDSDGQHWSAGLLHSKSRAVISRGWARVISENNIVEGDVCVFELYQTDESDSGPNTFPSVIELLHVLEILTDLIPCQ